ncbi:Flavodoxin-like fold family protein [Histomonas meleagridis]|uniref:Flavodoxin-like fold family protein n=1 Tax=Histomonas meleagridis TaxID=135588 RepID=UPI0035593BE2|nr:Flavodoxin-like fold family protein [Histomonas meleagridis]KAH0798401.1 Flavodoxin-like fold family protein [Histomonas meleagridis]
MKVLIVIAHCDPNKNATAYRFANACKEALEAAKNEVKITDLVHEGFDRTATPDDFKKIADPNKFNYIGNQLPADNLCETIRKQQELIGWCDHVVVIAPMYFFRLPACLYAWFERCFTIGFAFGKETMEKGPLKGKKASIIITAGGTLAHFASRGYAPLESILYSSTYQFRYCGFTATRTLLYPSANSPEVVEKEGEYIEKLKKAIVKLDSWPLLPILHGKPQEGEKNEPEIFAQLEPLLVDDLL